MKSKTGKGLALVLLTTLFVAAGQIFFKLASKGFEFSLEGILLNINIWIGFAFYAFGLIFLIFGLKDQDLSVVFPLISLSYVWVLIASFLLFREKITTVKIIGTLLIVAGVGLLANHSIKHSIKKQSLIKPYKKI